MAAQETLTKTGQNEAVRVPQEETVCCRPATDVFETQDSVVLKFDMPGVAKDQTDITVDKGLLTVTGHARTEQAGQCVYRETRIGDFQRQFTLAEDVRVEGITAEMEAGVLTLRIPKPENAKPRKIQIAGGA
jgi:HSP20 family protein